MVTSNKLPDKKVVKMEEQSNNIVVPQRTLLGEVNEHITCPLCRGYYIDATTIVECLHSFCRSCIIKHLQIKSYCPVCEMMINSAKPNIKPDKALQDIVYKLVPGLFQKEMERRQLFYSSRPGPAASATPEQRGEDTERIIFSPEDVISFSLEYADATDSDSISSKSSDSNETQQVSATSRRYLQCPAVVNISHLKKFLSMKFDIDSTQFAIDILYKRVPLPDYYTLMDIAYIYNWKRNEPMRFFYQIIDYIAIRNRLFDINRKGTNFSDRKPSPTSTEDTNVSSPTTNMNDQGSEASSGTDSPMPVENNAKEISNTSKKNNSNVLLYKVLTVEENEISGTSSNKSDEDVQKSQFLNSFELTAKSSSLSTKSSPTKSTKIENQSACPETPTKKVLEICKPDDTLKRKNQSPPNYPEIKKLKTEIEKTTVAETKNNLLQINSEKNLNNTDKAKTLETSSKPLPVVSTNKVSTGPVKDVKPTSATLLKISQIPESPGTKRSTTGLPTMNSPKRKTNVESPIPVPTTLAQKTVSPLKIQIPKSEVQSSTSKPTETPKQTAKKIPDLKPSVPMSHATQNKAQPVNKIRMDLLANNSDPTIDRSKILSQVKTSLGIQNPTHTSGDPLRSLFDSCKINIPSSLSITLTDQKQDPRNSGDVANIDKKQNITSKNLSTVSNSTHKVPSPPVHNYIEILKLPETDPTKQSKPDTSMDSKIATPNKTECTSAHAKPAAKSTEGSSKGPIPNLKPIADTKLAKQTGNFSSPITFQQTFEQQLQSLNSDKKPKLPKNKAQVPKLMPATPKAFSAASKLNSPGSKVNSMVSMESKPSTALDLSTPSNIQSQLSPHQSKTFETMQSIANLAKKQNVPPKAPSASLSQTFPNLTTRPLSSSGPSITMPPVTNTGLIKQDKSNVTSLITNTVKQETKSNSAKPSLNQNPSMSASYQVASLNMPSVQLSSRNQTRSPSSSPKLVIAEEKQSNHPEQNINQSNQISSTQISNLNTVPKTDSPKASPGPSKPHNTVKLSKPMPSVSKITGIRQPIVPTIKPAPSQPNFQNRLFTAHQALLRHRMDMEMNAWLKATQFMTNMAQQAQNEFNKDKQ